MLIRQLCGAILTLFLTASAFAAAPQVHELPPSQNTSSVHFQLTSQSESSQSTSYLQPSIKADTLNEVPAASAADMKDPLKYSVWVLIGLGPIMWIWLAFIPRIRRK